MIRTLTMLCLGTIVVLSLPAPSGAVAFKEIARFDVSAVSTSAGDPDFIGSNPSAVAWNGTQLYLAGFNASGATANTALIEVTNGASTGLNGAVFGSAFGAIATPNLRGYSGLDIETRTDTLLPALVASYDPGASHSSGIQLFDATTNLLVWSKTARGGSGVAFDFGFPGGDPTMGAGVAWTTFGSGRRPLQDTATGADIWTTADGMIISPGGGSFWRDMDFDPATGDFYARRSNDVIAATRTGDNSVSSPTAIVDNGENGAFVAGQMLEFMETDDFGSVIIYNDRPATGGVAFVDSVKVIDPTGSSLSATFSLLDGGAMADGVGYYDFDFDPRSQTLALMDFANRNVHIFSVVPEPATLGLVLFGALLAATSRRPGAER